MLIIDSINGKNEMLWLVDRSFALQSFHHTRKKSCLVLACAIVALPYFLKKIFLEVR